MINILLMTTYIMNYIICSVRTNDFFYDNLTQVFTNTFLFLFGELFQLFIGNKMCHNLRIV